MEEISEVGSGPSDWAASSPQAWPDQERWWKDRFSRGEFAITTSMIRTVLGGTSSGKAPGEDEVTFEVLRGLPGDVMTDIALEMTKIFE
eukprot:13120309-Alexandrium_andersonii.AAC.1